MSEVLDWVFSSIKDSSTMAQTPEIWLRAPYDILGSCPLHATSIIGLNVIGWCTSVWQLPVWLALVPLCYRCWSPCTAAVTYPDICFGGLLRVYSSLVIWDYIPCVLSIYGMNWVPASMLAFLPELSFYNVIWKHCSLENPDHKPEKIKLYVNPWVIPNECMECNCLSNIYINHL